MAASGIIKWPSSVNPIWEFTYVLANAPDAEGIAIHQARYRGKLVLYKGSLPSLRVQYNGSCGPYKDPLNYTNAKGYKIMTYSYVSLGLPCVAVQSYHEIGSYRLTCQWTFWANGVIQPRLYSAGLQCPYDHRHHAYWRFDFDIEGSGNDLALEYNTYTGNNGWGLGWHTKNNEITRLKNPSSNRSWAILDKSSQRGYHILPGPNDGVADSFSNRDFWLMRYHSNEDKNGMQGSASSDDLMPYINSELTDGQDLVIWFCGHLGHHAEGGGDEWHSVGPNLVPFGNWGIGG